MSNKIKVAVLDDYQHVALSMADWSLLYDKAEVAVFHDHQTDEAAIVERLLPFEVICVMRERTPLSKQLLSQ
ncbi:MAG TPA: D-2-hydroxyacid dehydrogenase family protein, partial [Mucilaginibacter sp.]